MSKFIYVFSSDDMEKLAGRGFILLKSDVKNNLYVFEADNELYQTRFALNDVCYMPSDILTF